MSFNLHWYEPPKESTYVGGGSTQLKYILAGRYGERDGSCRECFQLYEGDIPYVEGLVDAGVEDSFYLLKDLRKYGQLELRIE